MIVIGIHRVKRKATANIIHLAGVEVNRLFPSIFAAGALTRSASVEAVRRNPAPKQYGPSGLPISPDLRCWRALEVHSYDYAPAALNLRQTRQTVDLGLRILLQKPMTFV